jgi:hypothetical protein
LREAAELAKLPAGEREAYRQFWQDVAGVLKRARGKVALVGVSAALGFLQPGGQAWNVLGPVAAAETPSNAGKE